MSYKSTILYDYPIAYYPLDDLTVQDIQDFNEILSTYSTYQDILDDPILASYANIYGDVAFDLSGCENDGQYAGDPEKNILPIVVGNSRSTQVTSETYIVYNIVNDYTGGV